MQNKISREQKCSDETNLYAAWIVNNFNKYNYLNRESNIVRNLPYENCCYQSKMLLSQF